MWIVLGLSVGMLALVTLGVVLWMSNRGDDAGARGTSSREMSGDEMFTLGVVFAGAGVALSVSLGPAMIGMFAIGIVFMVLGIRKKRSEG